MKDVSHTNPYTGETVGQLFSRGPVVVADGGRANAVPSNDDEVDDEHDAENDEHEADKMRDVSHTPPKDAEGANRVFERGGSEDDVEYEE